MRNNSLNRRTFGKSAVIITAISMLALSCSKPAENVSIEVKTVSGSKAVSANLEFREMENSGRLLIVTFTNLGAETEKLSHIRISILPGESTDSESRFLYAGYDMGRTPIQQCGYEDEQRSSGNFLLIKHGESIFSKTGILTLNIFRPYITFSREEGIIITADGENKPIQPGETISFEKIVLESGKDWQDMLFGYGEQIAEIQQIKPKKIQEFKGWSTWDYYGRVYNDQDIYKNVDMLENSGIEANLIQIDGGWWTARGDYLSVKEDLLQIDPDRGSVISSAPPRSSAAGV